MLPQIIAEVLSEHQIVLTVNGQRMPSAPATREQLGRTIGELVTGLAAPTRVEVRELDGSVWADIITPTPASPDTVQDLVAPRRPVLLEFTAAGFVPGEDVAVALILRHISAGPDGTARALLDRDEQAGVVGEVILLGRISGTTSIERVSYD